MGIEAPDAIRCPPTSATVAVPASARCLAPWNHGLANKRFLAGGALPRAWLGLSARFPVIADRARGATQPPHRLVACPRALQAMGPRLLLAVQLLTRARRHRRRRRPRPSSENRGIGTEGIACRRRGGDAGGGDAQTSTATPGGTRRRPWLSRRSHTQFPGMHIPGRACQGSGGNI